MFPSRPTSYPFSPFPPSFTFLFLFIFSISPFTSVSRLTISWGYWRNVNLPVCAALYYSSWHFRPKKCAMPNSMLLKFPPLNNHDRGWVIIILSSLFDVFKGDVFWCSSGQLASSGWVIIVIRFELRFLFTLVGHKWATAAVVLLVYYINYRSHSPLCHPSSLKTKVKANSLTVM